MGNLTRYFLLTNIDWDTTEEDSEVKIPLKELTLPTTLVVSLDADADPESDLADELSDTYGWCVNKLNYEELPNKEKAEEAVVDVVGNIFNELVDVYETTRAEMVNIYEDIAYVGEDGLDELHDRIKEEFNMIF